MNWNGLLIGIGTFLLIGCFHVVVIKSEFHFGKKVWPVFVVVGCLILAGSVFLTHPIANALTAVLGISCLWSVKELFEQEERVAKVWFPSNPKRSSGEEEK